MFLRPTYFGRECSHAVSRSGSARTAATARSQRGGREPPPTLAAWHGMSAPPTRSLGKPAPFTDGQIAAIAHANDLVLVTINARDFPRFKGLQVTNWSKASDAAELEVRWSTT